MPRTTHVAREVDLQKKTPHELAEAAAEKVLAHALSYSEACEHGAPEWHALADHYAAKLTHLKRHDERQDEAEKMAFYTLGLAIGRRMAGGVR